MATPPDVSQTRFRGWRLPCHVCLTTTATCPTPRIPHAIHRGIRQPLKRGWITLFPVTILPCYGRLCLHQPLSGVDPSHLMSRAHHSMVGYAYINPLAGLIPHIPSRILPCYGRLCLHQPLSGVERCGAQPLSGGGHYLRYWLRKSMSCLKRCVRALPVLMLWLRLV